MNSNYSPHSGWAMNNYTQKLVKFGGLAAMNDDQITWYPYEKVITDYSPCLRSLLTFLEAARWWITLPDGEYGWINGLYKMVGVGGDLSEN